VKLNPTELAVLKFFNSLACDFHCEKNWNVTGEKKIKCVTEVADVIMQNASEDLLVTLTPLLFHDNLWQLVMNNVSGVIRM
jgi:hypothetical protein